MTIPRSWSNKGADDQKNVFRLTDMDPEFVSLVTAGANRQKQFQVVKADDASDDVPGDDADNDTKVKTHKARAEHFGIEMREDGNLSYPSGEPTTKSLYGDPVNLMYPLGVNGNEADGELISKAIALFEKDSDKYKDMISKVGVFARIITAALAADVDVTCQKDDEIYEALPAEIKERIKEKAAAGEDGGDDETDGNGNTSQGEDLSSWLQDAGDHVQTLSLDVAIQNALDAQADGDAPEHAAAKGAQEINTTAAPPVAKVGVQADSDGQNLQDAKIAKLEGELKKARREIVAFKAKVSRLSKGVGKSSVMLTGEVGAPSTSAHTEKSSPSHGAFSAGGDIAAAIRED